MRSKDSQYENQKKWRENNRERCKELQKNWRDKNKEKIRKRKKKWNRNNKEKVRHWYIKWKDNNKEKRQRYEKLWNKKNRKRQNLSSKKYAYENQNKIKAQRLAQKIKILTKQLCEICNNNLAIHRHHEDYNKPLEIKFLCINCHKKLHRKYRR